ncbi:biopolymer transporter ExbD [Bermanella marisrubri]|uniref:Biopolymer transport protein n=1 Tax=Bermanella marisrubri TaxID=207949 RepID=Q1N0P6_9GAMM|nr:biopolymer transporter ExbD [Bermanella marisrubri]EAT11787.1 Biopolymer transport protein [Oceanobacter sp. RED65] [Bermanella marisrubri]QIZ83822.1 biopolymer transporter ExbD [Bermanella marisrubri]
MKSSRRAKRMARHHSRNKKQAGLNLVSLMDIFTIMVFFLMMNQSDVEVMSNDSIKLPKSMADSQPQNTVNLMVSNDDIVVQGRAVAKVQDVLQLPEEVETIAALREELTYLAQRSPASAIEQEIGRPITIMGDEGIPYKVLKRIMATCQKAQFTQISLAVQKQAEQGA